MVRESDFVNTRYTLAEVGVYRGVRLPMRFSDAAAEYQNARSSVALFDRTDRGLLIARGPDRKTWLHALITNAVTTLADGAGVYAFAIDQRGRILFDLNVLGRPGELWLDLDREALSAARAHLERFLIIEDVQLHDAADEYARLGVAGPAAADIAARLGVANLVGLPSLAHVAIEGAAALLVRHDFAGLLGFELIVPRADAPRWWERLTGDLSVPPAGLAALDALRIEQGIPWLGRDIDDQVVAPETGQIERAISYHKGCYLGQEIVERMRSRGSLARRLVRVECADGAGLSLPCAIRHADREVGRLTSLVKHPVGPAWIGLAYLRTSVTDLSGLAVADPPRPLRVGS